MFSFLYMVYIVKSGKAGIVSKADEVRKIVARALLGTPIGSQLPTTSTLAKQAKAGHGTVQTALRAIEDEGAVETTAHGSYGRRVVAQDLLKLWAASGRGALTGVMPLPESREFAGIATAFATLAEARGLTLQLLFRQGSGGRMRFLLSERVDFIIASQASVTRAAGISSVGLGDYSYYGENSVVVITPLGRKPQSRGRVPIDRNSTDHAALTIREFPAAELIDTPYMLIPEMIAKGELDAAVWHRTTSSPLLTAVGLSVHQPQVLVPDDDLNRASLIWRQEDVGVGRLIADIFPPNQIETIQREVIAGVRVPQF
jgi:hypothetical protein